MAAKKLTFKVALFGALGAGALGYALLRRPRYLYDGQVSACEGSPPIYAIDQKCSELAMSRGNGSGKIIAPFDGVVETATSVGGTQVLVIRANTKPVEFHFTLSKGAPTVQAAQKFKAGDVIGQAERLKVSASRIEGSDRSPMSPSTWLIANSLLPSSKVGSAWCEDKSQVIVPHCGGITFRAPELPRWSLRTVRMTM